MATVIKIETTMGTTWINLELVTAIVDNLSGIAIHCADGETYHTTREDAEELITAFEAAGA
jgi:hypothetical protein